MGEIKERRQLYRVFTTSFDERANVASVKEALSIDELHCCLGHISHDCAKFLVVNGLVKGNDLEMGIRR
jgi:hypothetical protein